MLISIRKISLRFVSSGLFAKKAKMTEFKNNPFQETNRELS